MLVPERVVPGSYSCPRPREGSPGILPGGPSQKRTWRISTNIFLGTYHEAGTVLEARLAVNPADGSHTQGWGEMVNSSVITMATRPHLICAHYSSVFLSHAFLLISPRWPPGRSLKWAVTLLPQALCTAIPSTWNPTPTHPPPPAPPDSWLTASLPEVFPQTLQ